MDLYRKGFLRKDIGTFIYHNLKSKDRAVLCVKAKPQGTASQVPDGLPWHRYSHVDGDPREVSPVMDQFLECVWQLSLQFPCAFEYNERFLLHLHDQVYSCQYGNFLGNCQKERVDLRWVRGLGPVDTAPFLCTEMFRVRDAFCLLTDSGKRPTPYGGISGRSGRITSTLCTGRTTARRRAYCGPPPPPTASSRNGSDR